MLQQQCLCVHFWWLTTGLFLFLIAQVQQWAAAPGSTTPPRPPPPTTSPPCPPTQPWPTPTAAWRRPAPPLSLPPPPLLQPTPPWAAADDYHLNTSSRAGPRPLVTSKTTSPDTGPSVFASSSSSHLLSVLVFSSVEISQLAVWVLFWFLKWQILFFIFIFKETLGFLFLFES